MSTSEEWLYNDVLDVDVTDVSLQAADDVPTFKNVFFVLFFTRQHSRNVRWLVVSPKL